MPISEKRNNMASLCSRLNNRIALYTKVQVINELGEKDYQYQQIKTIYAEILPQSGNEKTGQGNTLFSEISHKIIIRANAVKQLSNDMYIVFDSKRYDVKYFQPNYKYHNYIELYCKLVVE